MNLFEKVEDVVFGEGEFACARRNGKGVSAGRGRGGKSAYLDPLSLSSTAESWRWIEAAILYRFLWGGGAKASARALRDGGGNVLDG